VEQSDRTARWKALFRAAYSGDLRRSRALFYQVRGISVQFSRKAVVQRPGSTDLAPTLVDMVQTIADPDGDRSGGQA